jgi:hypothetical protein
MNLRQTMPTVAAWVDELRSVFGADSVDPALRRGEFWAREGGAEAGTRLGNGYVPHTNREGRHDDD